MSQKHQPVYYACAACGLTIAKRDGKGKNLQPLNHVRFEQKIDQAPRIVCNCGKVTIFLKGAL